MNRSNLATNNLILKFPEIAQEWNTQKNVPYKPSDFSCNSHKKVWWKCSQGHEWQADIANRTRLKRGCPYCSRKKVLVGSNDLATVNPELAKEWHPIKNDIKPCEVFSGSHKYAWWICKKGHEWKAQIKSRSNGAGCPYCSSKLVSKGENDLATVYPELLPFWHPSKNMPTSPSDVTYGSGKKFWWICKNNHEYKMSVDQKRKSKGCPICQRRRKTSFPEQAIFYYVKQVFPEATNSFREIFDNSMEIDIYIPTLKTGIEYDGKVFHSSKNSMVRDSRKYQICRENGIKLVRVMDWSTNCMLINADYTIKIPDEKEETLTWVISNILYHLRDHLRFPIDIDVKRDKFKIIEYLEKTDCSLQEIYPDIAKEFDLERNAPLTAAFFHSGSNEKVWWRCKNCGFKWSATISSRTGRDKTGCPKCSSIEGGAKHHKSVLEHNGSLAATHPELLSLWNHEINGRNGIFPDQVVAGSGKKVWWKCEKRHTWQASIERVVKGGGCPFCLNKKILQGYNDLATTNPNLLEEWDFEKNIEMSPYQIGAGSGKRAWWVCKKCGHQWQSIIASRKAGAGCPNCDYLRKFGNQYAKRKK